MISYTVSDFYTAESDFPLTDERCERSLNEFGAWKWEGTFQELQSVLDKYRNGRAKVFQENLSIKDINKSITNKLIKESFNSEDRIDKRAYRNIFEIVKFNDLKISRFTSTFRKDFIKAKDFNYAKVNLNIPESIKISDPLLRNVKWKRNYSEYSNISDRPINHAKNNFFENISSKDSGNRMFDKNTIYSVLVEDKSRFGFKFDRDFLESISVHDDEYSVYVAAYKETCKLIDEIVHNSNGVLYDISFSEGPLSREEFKSAVNTPAGYSPFVDFRVGDYEYKDAIYRFVMQKKDLDVNPLLSDLSVHVDIPDTNDRGTANIPAEVTRVYFNKSYYNPPEVVVTVIGGSESSGIVIPYLISTDKYDDSGRYFEVKLVNDSGTVVSGMISWTAKGY